MVGKKLAFRSAELVQRRARTYELHSSNCWIARASPNRRFSMSTGISADRAVRNCLFRVRDGGASRDEIADRGVALPGVVDIIDWRAGPHRRDRDLRNLIAQVIF